MKKILYLLIFINSLLFFPIQKTMAQEPTSRSILSISIIPTACPTNVNGCEKITTEVKKLKGMIGTEHTFFSYLREKMTAIKNWVGAPLKALKL